MRLGFLSLLIIALFSSCQIEDDFALVLDESELCGLNNLIPTSIIYDRLSYNSSQNFFSCYHTPLTVFESDTSECIFPSQKFFDQQSYGFYIFDITKKSKRRLFGVQIHSPNWSPDGKWLLWSNNDDIFKMPLQADTLAYDQVRRLTQDSVLLKNPKWSPSGQSILVYADFVEGGVNFTSKGWYVLSNEGENPRFQGIMDKEGIWQDESRIIFLSDKSLVSKQVDNDDFIEISIVPDSLSLVRSLKLEQKSKTIFFIAKSLNRDFFHLYSYEIENREFQIILDESILEFDIVNDQNLVVLINENQITVVQNYNLRSRTLTPLFSYDVN